MSYEFFLQMGIGKKDATTETEIRFSNCVKEGCDRSADVDSSVFWQSVQERNKKLTEALKKECDEVQFVSFTFSDLAFHF